MTAKILVAAYFSEPRFWLAPRRKQLCESQAEEPAKSSQIGLRVCKTEARYVSNQNAGWSSLVARQAHNLKVAGSNPAPATKPTSLAWVYIVQNPVGQFYVGMTTDLDQRVQDHNAGISRSSKHRGPWKFGLEPGMCDDW